VNSYHTFAVTYADPAAPRAHRRNGLPWEAFPQALTSRLQSLLTEEGAIQTTSNNIANVNTPGYARQRPDLAETPPVQLAPHFWKWVSCSMSPVCATHS